VVFSSDNGPAYKPNVPDSIGHGSPGNLRGWKASTFEGGIKEPTIACWKGKIKPGQVIDVPCIMMDWFPTFAELAGVQVPTDRPMDGHSLAGLMLGTGQRPKADFCFYRHEELQAIRYGDWKYKKAMDATKNFQAHGELLFNLKEDPNETINLIEQYPDTAEMLKKRMEDYIDNLGNIPPPKIMAIPFDDPRKKINESN
jgi:arylsulfatase A-like enzyme